MADAPFEPPPPSGDIGYELQGRMYELLATVSLGGVGLTITLAGSMLQGQPLIWIATIFYGLAALLSVSALQNMIANLFKGDVRRARSRVAAVIVSTLIGMGTGSLGMTVYKASEGDAAAQAAPAQSAPAR